MRFESGGSDAALGEKGAAELSAVAMSLRALKVLDVRWDLGCGSP